MPEHLTKSEITSQTDHSVAKQYDSTTPVTTQFTELYSIIDSLNTSMLNTTRPTLNLPIGRCMAVSKRRGPDILYLANAHSAKITDIHSNPSVQITFHDPSSQNWVSVSGTATTTSSSDGDPRIHDLYTPFMSAWFGDLGDGVHDGSARDPRMTLVEVRARHIVYWKKEVSTLGFAREIVQSVVQGDVAQTGVLRQLGEGEIEEERKRRGVDE